MTLDRWIEGHARFTPQKLAIRDRKGDHSYHALAQDITRDARVLHETLKLKRGARVGYYATNSAQQLIMLFACARLGLILVPLNWRLAASELKFIADDCALGALFFDPNFSRQVEDILANLPDCARIPLAAPAPNKATSSHPSLADLRAALHDAEPGAPAAEARVIDPLLIVYTSGTTGRPKGAVLTQQAIITNAMMSWHAHAMSTRDHVLGVLPLFHVGGLNIQVLPALLCGASVTLHASFEPGKVLRCIFEEKISHFLVVPTVLQALITCADWKTAQLSSLRAMAIGSTDVPVELIEAVHKRDVPVIQIYGATETGPLAIYQSIDLAFDTVGSIGRRGLLCDIRLVGADGRDVEPDADGEIWVRGDNVLSHYWHDPAGSAAAIASGWFKTGDVASLDRQGNYWFKDRLKNVIISGGENIYPAELERVLRRIEGIGDVCVIGRADNKWGEVPVAVVVRSETRLTGDEILAAFDGVLARFKHPRDVIFVDDIPKNALGKIQIAAVRELLRRASLDL